MVLHNPNNWHWVDKNCISWSREYFNEKLIGVSAEDEKNNVKVAVKTVKSIEGDVEVCQRKGKVISLFDVAVNLGFEGKSGEKEATGDISIPEVSYDSEEDSYQFSITLNPDVNETAPIKALIRSQLVPKLRKILYKFGTDLIATHGNEIQHNGNESIHWGLSDKTKANISSKQGVEDSKSSSNEKKMFGINVVNTTNLTLKPAFSASPEELYRIFTNEGMVAAWSRSKPELEVKTGGKFKLFGGNISGSFTELNENKNIKMKWRLKEWKPDHYADLTLDFVPEDTQTVMVTKWVGVPVDQRDRVEANFENYYVKPIKGTFGLGLL